MTAVATAPPGRGERDMWLETASSMGTHRQQLRRTVGRGNVPHATDNGLHLNSYYTHYASSTTQRSFPFRHAQVQYRTCSGEGCCAEQYIGTWLLVRDTYDQRCVEHNAMDTIFDLVAVKSIEDSVLVLTVCHVVLSMGAARMLRCDSTGVKRVSHSWLMFLHKSPRAAFCDHGR